MSYLDNKYYNILELNQIIDKLKEEVILDSNMDSLNNITLSNDIDYINEMLDEVDEASKLLLRLSRFPLLFKTDVTNILKKVCKYGVITIEELIQIMNFFDTIKSISLYEQQAKGYLIPCPCFNKYSDMLYYPKDLNLRIKDIITPYGEVLDSASSNLR